MLYLISTSAKYTGTFRNRTQSCSPRCFADVFKSKGDLVYIYIVFFLVENGIQFVTTY